MGYLDGARLVCGAAASPSLASVRAGKATLKRGDRGDAVRYVQAIVETVVDGDYGSKTETAVTAFQVVNAIGATGVVDQKTLAAIDKRAGGQFS